MKEKKKIPQARTKSRKEVKVSLSDSSKSARSTLLHIERLKPSIFIRIKRNCMISTR